MLTARHRPELTLGQAAVLLTSSAIGVVSLAGAASADGGGPGGVARVTCPQGSAGCSLGVSERHVVHRSTGSGTEPSRSGSGGDPAGIAKRFAWDNAMCVGLGALAPACMAANAAGLFAGGAPSQNGDAPAAPAPIVVARRAAARLHLPEPVIRSSPSPGQEQLVGLPTWLWIDRSSWTSRSATAAVPGVSVTARARPSQARWEMGDGSVESCSGPGTPWRAGRDPASVSPTCGHVFRRSSAEEPGAAFAVTATVTWSVSWSGGGESGTLPGLTTSSTTRMRVAESQGLAGGEREGA